MVEGSGGRSGRFYGGNQVGIYQCDLGGDGVGRRVTLGRAMWRGLRTGLE